MLRVAIIDHHPAFRRGVQVAIEQHAELTFVGSAADRYELWSLLHGADVRVLVLGQPQRDHATELCRQVRIHEPACRVLLCASAALTVAAILAGAHGLIDKTADESTLLDAVWTVAGGGRILPVVTPDMRREAAGRVQPEDRAILAMLLAGTSASDVAAVAGLTPRELDGRCAGIIASLAGRRQVHAAIRQAAA